MRTIPKRAKWALRRLLKRRSSIEPTIGHLKSDNRLHRNHLKGQAGDKINAVLSAAGYNFRKLLAAIAAGCFFWQIIWLSRSLGSVVTQRGSSVRSESQEFTHQIPTHRIQQFALSGR